MDMEKAMRRSVNLMKPLYPGSKILKMLSTKRSGTPRGKIFLMRSRSCCLLILPLGKSLLNVDQSCTISNSVKRVSCR